MMCMYVCMAIITCNRVRIDRVRLPNLLVVSWTGKMKCPYCRCICGLYISVCITVCKAYFLYGYMYIHARLLFKKNLNAPKPSEHVCMYVCMVITYSRVWINRVRLPILLVVSWTGKIIFPCPRVCLRIWSRETGSAVPSRVSLLISILRLNLVLTFGIPPEFRGGVHLWNRHTPPGQSRVYRVTQLRTDGVHCRESASTGPVNLKVVPNECCLGRSPWTNWYSPLFPTPTIGITTIRENIVKMFRWEHWL